MDVEYTFILYSLQENSSYKATTKEMGCVESIPVSDQDLARPHPVNKNFPPITPPTVTHNSQHEPLVLFIPKNAHLLNKNRQFGVVLPNGSSFRGVNVGGQSSSGRCKFTVWDSNNRLLAACLGAYSSGRYKIYMPQPVFPGQIPSKQEYYGQQLFTYVEVDAWQVRLNTVKGSATPPEFTVHGTTSRRVVKRDGVIAATIEVVSEKWGRNPQRKISMCPGIDPILLLCLTGIYSHGFE